MLFVAYTKHITRKYRINKYSDKHALIGLYIVLYILFCSTIYIKILPWIKHTCNPIAPSSVKTNKTSNIFIFLVS